MEGFHGSSSSIIGNFSKAPKIKLPPGMKTQPLMISSNFDSYSENLDLNAPLIRYLCAGSPVAGKRAVAGDGGGGGFVPRGSLSPLSALENLIDRSPPPLPPPLAVYGTPVKAVEGEEVLVIDGVTVSGGGKKIPRFSGSDSSSAYGSSGKSLIKTDICRSSEDSGNYRYSSKCQFAHGKEDLRPTHPSIKNKTESQLCRSYKSPGLSYSPNSRFLPHVIAPILAEAAVTPTRRASPIISRTSTASPTTSLTPIKIPSPTTPMTRIKTPSPTTSRNTKNTLSTARARKEWSPQDDGIEVALPCSSAGKHPSRESVNVYIDGVLSGRTTRRLPVFSEICYD